MPWRESSVTEERLRFVGRLLDGGRLAEGVGFEPTVDLRPRQFSRLVP